MRLAQFALRAPLALAPMAGVTDRPFRLLCRRFGAAVAASEMVGADPALWESQRSRQRRDHAGEPEPRVVQIAGGDAAIMAEAAARAAADGAQIVDVNMGCPAKKVCNKAAGSALLRDEAQVAAILSATVAAAGVPVTLKIRTGWSRQARNGTRIARIAEDCGVAALAVHGRTREDRYDGAAEYEIIRDIKAAIRIPVFANGDIDSGAKARRVLDYTGADGVMIGRAALGRPWLFREIASALARETQLAPPAHAEVRDIMLAHLEELYAFYGEYTGLRVARKHLGWYRDAAFGDAGRRPQRREASSAATSAVAESAPVDAAGAALFAQLRSVESAPCQLELARAWFTTTAARAA
jgi:tRNA-dihydrouridine synthase B